MKYINSLIYICFYIKGVMRFRSKAYTSAEKIFKKAKKYCPEKAYSLFFQYYGQTLLCLKKIDKSFHYLAKSYQINCNDGWKAATEEEYFLAKDTIKALEYIDQKYNLKIDDFDPDISIVKEYKQGKSGRKGRP